MNEITIPQLLWAVVGTMGTLLLTSATFYIRRMARGFDQLAQLVESHDRQLAALGSANVIERLNSHGNRITELAQMAKYQEGLTREVLESLRSLLQLSGELKAQVQKLG